ncbi:MAG: single-stranded-DNA-specific exonuclease RecJ [Wenzhouxiangella sp.]
MIRSVRIRRREAPPTPMTGVHPVLARVLAGRGQRQAPDYSLKGLLPPSLSGLPRAADILAEAIRTGQRILVVGDFDADGATGTALAVRALTSLGAREVAWKVPDRFRHGYGLSSALVEEIDSPAPHVLVTVDQGVSSIAGVAAAQAKGMQVIVTDHHLPGPQLPPAEAIVNPNLADEAFGSTALAGVGVMFYTAMAVRARLRELGWFDRRPLPRLDGLLDLVALGTVADLVPLDQNNRRLVYQGLARMRAGQCSHGVRALLEVAGRNLRHVQASDLGFAAGPRLNAAGRLEDMGIGIRCLLADSERAARALAGELDALNDQRQALQADMLKAAEAQADELAGRIDGAAQGLCVFDPEWHQGVVGLVAGRLMERLQRPVLAFAPAEPGSSELKGSGRSPAGLHMRDLLVEIDTRQPGLMGRFGGHARAAGLSLERDRLAAFKRSFDECLARHEFADEIVLSDGELGGDELTAATAAALEQGGPWGQGWPEPLFDGRFRVLERRIVGQVHLKMRLQPEGGGEAVEAIAFRAAGRLDGDLPELVHLTYRLELNRWRGRVSPQLNIQHRVALLQRT